MHGTWKSRLAALSALVTTMSLGLVSPVYAAGNGTVSWSMSNPQPSTAGVRYTWSFTPATGGWIDSVTFTVPHFTTAPGGLSVIDVYGITGGTAALDTSTDTVTYSVTSATNIAAGTPMLISIDGFTNTTSANSYTSDVTTYVGAGAVDTGTSGAVVVNSNTTTVNVVVARSTSFSSNTTSFNMIMDPSVAALTNLSYPVVLTIATNATSGYTLNTKINHAPTGLVHGGNTVPAITPDMATGVTLGSFTTDTFGYAMATSGGNVGTIQSVPLGAGKYVGYTTGGENPFTAAGPTNGDTVTITNRAKIDYQQNADKYMASITYTVTPSF